MTQYIASPLAAAGMHEAAPLQIAANCWMVGYRNPASLLQCNTYLRIFEDAAGPVRVCVDPGSQFDYSVIEANLQTLIGGVAEVDVMSVNHQDPDVVGNAFAFCDANPHIAMLVSHDTWRLAQHLLINPGRVEFAGVRHAQPVQFAGQRRWQAVPTPFCHFRGAVAFYDPEIRTLFTGDLFGGLNQIGRVHLFAEENDWQGVAQFHQIYMPSREVLRYAVRQIRTLTPAVEIIAPQHGHVIVGDRVPQFLERMEGLLVGHDLLACELDEQYLGEYSELLHQLVEWVKEVVGDGELRARLTAPETRDAIAPFVRITAQGVDVVRGSYSAAGLVFLALARGESADFVNEMRGLVMRLCGARQLPVPPVGLGVERMTN